MGDLSERALEELDTGRRGVAIGSRWTPSVARLSTGVSLPYVEQGGRDGTPVVLLHGYTDSWRSFEPVLEHLPDGVRAFAVTLRGHGDTDRPAEERYRLEDWANDLASWMDRSSLRSAVIVGHSMGAHVAQRFAIDHPERTRALVLVGALRHFASNAAIRELQSVVDGMTDRVDAAFVRAFQESTVSRPVRPAFLEMVVGESLKVPVRVWKAALDGLVASDLSTERARIERPTLLVWGTADALVPREDQEELLRAIPGSELLEYPAAGHAVHWQEPERFAADLTAYVRRV